MAQKLLNKGGAASKVIASIENMAFQAGLRLHSGNQMSLQSFIAIENKLLEPYNHLLLDRSPVMTEGPGFSHLTWLSRGSGSQAD